MGIRDLFCVRCLLSRSFSSVLFVYPRPLEAGGSSVYLVSSVFVCSLMGGGLWPSIAATAGGKNNDESVGGWVCGSGR